MFDDPKKNLRRLEQQLWEERISGKDPEEDWDLPDEEEAEDPEAPPIRNYANGYGRSVRNRDRGDVDLEQYSSQVYEPPKKKGLGGLLLLLLLEMIGILAVVAYWKLYLLRG